MCIELAPMRSQIRAHKRCRMLMGMESKTMKREYIAVATVALTAMLMYLFRYEIAHAYAMQAGGCAANSTAAVSVRPLIDARTGTEVPHEVAIQGTLIVQDGAYADTTALLEGAAPDRPGTYQVIARLPGYHEWRHSGVRAERRPCSVRTARVSAVLQPIR